MSFNRTNRPPDLRPTDEENPQPWNYSFLGNRPPSSPWAEHFGLEGHAPTFFGSNHTWIAPREPASTPKPAGEPSDPIDYSPKEKLRPEDYDAVFLSERLQVSRFKGLRTREAQIFAQVDAYQPPGDGKTWFENWFNSQQIEVRESDHLSIFKKDRWLNYNNPMSQTIKTVHGQELPRQQMWSVDFKPLWKELSVCAELADRILKHSFKGTWMQALLARPDLMVPSEQHTGEKKRTIHTFSRKGYLYMPQGPSAKPPQYIEDPDDDDPLTAFDKNADIDRVELETRKANSRRRRGKAPKEVPKKSAAPTPANQFFAPSDWIDDVDGCYYSIEDVSKLVYWTFFDESGDPRPEEVNKAGTYYTKGIFEDSRYCVISLNVECIRPLLDAASSPMERILAINMVAITMIRGILDAVRAWLKQNYGYYNITFEKEGVIDLQSSFENAVFGGRIDFPFHHDAAGIPRKGNSLILTGSEFPTMGDFGIKWFPNFDEGAKYHTIDTPRNELPFKTTWRSYPIPGIWSVNLLCKDFWKNEVPKAFETLYFPKCFRTKEHRLDSSFGSHHFETRTYSAQFRAPFKKDAGMVKLNQLLAAKRNEVAALRPWYWDAYYRWQVTPYSMPITRWYLNQVNVMMLNTHEWDEFRVQEITRFWQWQLPSFNGAPLAWFYSAIADLVAACLPVREENKLVPGLQKKADDKAFRCIAGSNASNPVHVQEARNTLSRGDTERREFELQARSMQSRRACFLRAWNKFGYYFENRPHETGFKNALQASMRHLSNHLDGPSRAQRYWDAFSSFTLPKYTDQLVGTNWEHADTRKAVWTGVQRTKGPEFQKVGAVDVRPAMLVQFAASVADAEENLMQELPAGLKLSVFEDWIDYPRTDFKSEPSLTMFPLGPTGFSRRVRGAVTAPEFRYLTVGEIADHAKADDLWVIDEDGDELAVYDISEACKRVKLTMQDVEKAVSRSDYGFHIKPGLEWNLPKRLTQKVGYVLRWMNEEEVAEHDGQDGRLFWIKIGLNVFNITNFPFETLRLENALKSNPGGNPMPKILSDKSLRRRLPAIVDALMPWRCGRLREIKTSATSELLFTEDEIAWHEFVGTGMYTIIDGDVYDLTEYVADHPGGSTIISNYAGRDATKAFLQSHGNKCETILQDYQHLRIGRIIKTRPSHLPLKSDEFQYNSYIYKLPPINDYPVYFGGKVLDDELRRQAEEGYTGLNRIWRRDDACINLTQTKYCVARRELKKEVRRVDGRGLKACDGREGDDWYNEGWASIGEDVYNLTTVIQHGPTNLANSLKEYLGSEIKNTKLADLVRQRYPFRIVAKLTDNHVFEDMEGLRSGMLNDGTPVLHKPKWNDSYSVLDEAFPDVPRVLGDTQGQDVDQVPLSRGRTPRQALKRTRTPSPAHRSKLRVLTTRQAKHLVNRETIRLAQVVKDMGVLDPLADPEESLVRIKDNDWQLEAKMLVEDGEELVRRRMAEEGVRLGVEVDRSVMAMMERSKR